MFRYQSKCEHEVPCTCDEYLEKLTLDQLLNLRIEFGKIVTDSTKYPGAVIMEISDSSIISKLFGRSIIKEAKESITKINKAMEQKYGCLVV